MKRKNKGQSANKKNKNFLSHKRNELRIAWPEIIFSHFWWGGLTTTTRQKSVDTCVEALGGKTRVLIISHRRFCQDTLLQMLQKAKPIRLGSNRTVHTAWWPWSTEGWHKMEKLVFHRWPALRYEITITRVHTWRALHTEETKWLIVFPWEVTHLMAFEKGSLEIFKTGWFSVLIGCSEGFIQG